MPNDDSALSRVAAQVAACEREAKEAAENARAREEERHVLAAEGMQRIRPVLKELFERVKREAAPAAQLDHNGKAVRLGDGRLVCDLVFPYLESRIFPRSQLTVVAGAFLGLQQNSQRYPGRSGNLWYGDFDRSGAYSWWETAYMGPPCSPSAFAERCFTRFSAPSAPKVSEAIESPPSWL
jgi:hypothetical protein